VVLGVGCVAIAVPFLLRILTTPRANAFGISVGPSIGWGLWLLSIAGIVQISTAITVTVQLSKAVDRLTPVGQSQGTWTTGCAAGAGVCAAAILMCSSVYFALHWDYSSDTDTDMASAPTDLSLPSFTMPSFPSVSAPTQEVTTTSPSAKAIPGFGSEALAAATAAEQEKMDRRAARDFAGEWLLFTKVLRDGISQDDFVHYN
jgi:hypothetical protein